MMSHLTALSTADVLTRVDRLTPDRLRFYVHQSWVRPVQDTGDGGASFDETDLARVRLIVELTDDLAVNDEAVPVILSLIDEASSLRRAMHLLDAVIGQEGLHDRLAQRLEQLLAVPPDGKA